MNIKLVWIVGATALLVAAHASAQITFYEREGFRGQAFAQTSKSGTLSGQGSMTGRLRSSSTAVGGRCARTRGLKAGALCSGAAAMTRCGD
jgi:hypothetical protein